MNPYVIEQSSRLLHALLRTEPTALPQSSDRANVLVIKPASLGDVLMSTAFLASLRASLPHARITVLVTTWAKEALAGNPHCDCVLDSGSVGFPGRYGFSAYTRCIARLRKENFSHCFVLDRSPLMALLPRLAGIPWRAGLNSSYRGIALHVGVACPADRHETEIYLDVLRAVGFDAKEPRLHFRPQAAEVEIAGNLLAEHDLLNTSLLIAIHPGGGKNPGEDRVSKRWSSKAFAALADKLGQTHGAGIILVGGPDDMPITSSIQGSASAPVIDVAGKLSFAQLGGLIQHCNLFIGNDSAPMHLAAAVDTPVIGLFGPTSPECYGPYGVASAVVRFRTDRGEEPDRSEVEAAGSAAERLLML